MGNVRTVNGSNKPRPRRRSSKLRVIVLYMQIGLLLLFGVAVGGIVGTFISVSRMLPKVTDYSPPEVTKILSSDEVLLATVGAENREFVDMKQIPKELQQATVAIEDSRFYDHGGVDFRGIARAAVKNIVGGRIDEGGSTITQQLARNVYLTQRRTISRKMREAVLAVIIERNYTKAKILELYLNQIFYGSGAFGVEAASKVYFGKDVQNLDLAECALLAGLARAPSSLSPHNDLDAAVARRNVVLARMAELHVITQEQKEKAQAEKPRIVPLTATKYRSLAPYFTDYVKKYLRDKYAYDDMIYRGGLRVYTTVNYRMQEAAQKALRDGVMQARRNRQVDPKKGNAALICIEPETGYIRAMVGGAEYEKSEFNRATQARRQPGSAFKAFVYTAAVDTLGWNANHIVKGGRYRYTFGDGRVWTPKNYNGEYRPYTMTMKRAVADSVNVPAVRTAMEVGLNTVIRYAHLLGVKSEIQAYPALAIGGISGIRPIEMAAAYGVFASGGFYIEPTPIAKITNADGATIEEAEPNPRRVLPDRTVSVMDELFRAVVTKGTAAWKLAGFPNARGKTGTTNSDVDAWFIGYVPKKLVTAVWMGNDDHTPMGHKISGSGLCAPIWKDYMYTAVKVYDDIHRGKPRPKPVESQASHPAERRENRDNRLPDAVQETDKGTVRVKICDESQLLATGNCPSWHVETMVKGTEPKDYCNIHEARSRGRTRTEHATDGDSNPGDATPPPQPDTPKKPDDSGDLRMTPPPQIPITH